MKFKSNLAYHKNKSNHLRQHELFEPIHVGRVESGKKFFPTKLYMFLIVVTTLFLSAFIFNIVKANEITQQINITKTKLRLQNSEHIRLQTELEQKINLKKIENYAKSKGMKKLDNNQINYLYFRQPSSIELPQNKSNDETLFQKIKNVLTNITNKLKKYFS